MSEALEFLDANLPARLEDAITRIKETDHVLLAKYDKNVLGRYEIRRHLRYLLDGDDMGLCSLEIIKTFFGEKVSTRIVAQRLLEGAKKGGNAYRKLLPLYAARAAFVDLMRQYSVLVSNSYNDPPFGRGPKFALDLEMTAYGVRRAYETLCEMVLQTARKKKP